MSPVYACQGKVQEIFQNFQFIFMKVLLSPLGSICMKKHFGFGGLKLHLLRHRLALLIAEVPYIFMANTAPSL